MSDKTSFYRIQIKEGDEHHSSVMEIYDESAFFYGSYKQAAQAVTAIVRQSEKYYDNQKNGFGQECNRSFGEYAISDGFEHDNNIVAFCADRGQGKTSAMLSMAGALSRIPIDLTSDIRQFWNDPFVNLSSDEKDNPVLSTHFEILGVVDPTCMETKDSLIRTIMSKMFKTASDVWNEKVNMTTGGRYYAQNKDKKDELAKKFLTCFKGIDYLYREKAELSASYDDLNMMAEYGDSNNFKKSFHDLIKSYLEFMSIGTGQNKAMLVIPIDDADLNSDNAYSIMEEIRKYCILPNVLIFMALHIGTLSRTIEQYFLKQYETLIVRGRDTSIQERCHRAMERYIDKLLPASHKIYLMSIDSFLRDEYDKFSLSYTDRNGEEKFIPNTRFSNKTVNTYQEQLIMLIYQKTGIVLHKPDSYLHEFLPESMRELNHFLYFFTRMPDVISIDQNDSVCGTFEHILGLYRGSKYRVKHGQKDSVIIKIDERLSNLELMENYFLYSWCPLRLSSLQIKVIEGMHKCSRKMKNHRTIELLKRYVKDELADNTIPFVSREQQDLPEDYVPFSDVVYTLHNLEKSENSMKYIFLIYAVRMYYTIYFHKVALNGIKSWVTQNRSETPITSPFDDLVALTGFRLFPMEYYEKRKLPKLVFECKSKKKIELTQAGLVFYHFLCEAQKRKDDATYLLLYNKPVLTETKTGSGKRITSKYQFFDFFRPIISILSINDFYNRFFGGDDIPIKVPCGALRLICNLDLQHLLYQYYFQKGKENLGKINSSAKPGQAPYDMISGVFSEVDQVIERESIVKTNISFKVLMDHIYDDPTSFDAGAFAVLDNPEKKAPWKYVYESDKFVTIPKYDVNDVKSDITVVLIKEKDKKAIKGSLKIELYGKEDKHE